MAVVPKKGKIALRPTPWTEALQGDSPVPSSRLPITAHAHVLQEVEPTAETNLCIEKEDKREEAVVWGRWPKESRRSVAAYWALRLNDTNLAYPAIVNAGVGHNEDKVADGCLSETSLGATWYTPAVEHAGWKYGAELRVRREIRSLWSRRCQPRCDLNKAPTTRDGVINIDSIVITHVHQEDFHDYLNGSSSLACPD